MKSQINKIVALLLREIEAQGSQDAVYVISTYITILYTFVSNNILSSSRNTYKDSELYKALSHNYSDLINLYEIMHNSIKKETEADVISCLQTISNDKSISDEFIISDFYQQTKSHILKVLNEKNEGYLAKKNGKHLLYATQFFTDTYMVEYLVNQVLSTYGKIDNVLFVDPTSGGGNFLTYLYRVLYKKYENTFDANSISSHIFKNHLLGFDLDCELSRIASLSLFMLAYKTTGKLADYEIYNFGGIEDDKYGSINSPVLSTVIGGLAYNDILDKAKLEGKKIVYITNPPFMGKRDMDMEVKDFLLSRYPAAKGDMCFSFMQHLIEGLRQEDSLAIVSQNGWLCLSSLKSLRQMIIENVHLRTCVDLGSNAFKNINGEKTNVVLAVFQKKTASNEKAHSTFINLRPQSIEDKALCLKEHLFDEYTVQLSDFLQNKAYEFNYQLGDDLSTLAQYTHYGRYAKCMQGSSTGDNNTMVKYIWETTDEDWVLASKGGGFSKWQGLNYYKVKWGKDGEHVKNNKGGVLRNPSLIENTHLVYSDTGTLGLNVRVKMDGQVFIASGPGIYVLSGDSLCHMAFLNSKIASFFMRIINPKFTISGGYIQKLPIANGILDNSEISSLAILCQELKQRYLETKLPNFEYKQCSYESIVSVNEYIVNSLKQDILNMYERLVAERMIDRIIEGCYNLSSRLSEEFKKQMSGYQKHESATVNIALLDDVLSKMIGDNCMLLGKKVSGKLIGSENFIEILSYQTGISCSALIANLAPQVNKLSKMLALYKNDFVHKLILALCGINKLDNVGFQKVISPKDILNKLTVSYPYIQEELKLTETEISRIIETTHSKVFFNHPIITAQ